MKKTKHQTEKKYTTRKLVYICLFATAMMFAFGYALVPLYNVMCKQFGVNGKPDLVSKALGQKSKIDTSRTITVQFLSTLNERLPWEFYPETISVEIHPGENKQIYYFAANNSGRDMTVQAIPSVSPGIAANFLHKTECFCFTQQFFKKDQSMHMPLLFHIDPDLPKDITTISLSYTLFNADKFVNSSNSKKKGGL